MQWLPVTKELSSKAPVEKLVGEVGDAMRFVQYVRNLAVHPGKHAYETSWLTIGQREYDIVHGVAQTVFDRLYELLGELEPGQAQ